MEVGQKIDNALQIFGKLNIALDKIIIFIYDRPPNVDNNNIEL